MKLYARKHSSSRRQEPTTFCDENQPVLYVNLVVIESKQAVKEAFEELLSSKAARRSWLPTPVAVRVASKASRVATKLTSNYRVIKKLSKIVVKTAHGGMAARGLTGVINEVYRKGTYLVFEIQVQKVDASLFAKEADVKNMWVRKKARNQNVLVGAFDADERQSFLTTIVMYLQKVFLVLLTTIYWWVGAENTRIFETVILPSMIQSNMEVFLERALEDKLGENHIVADAVVLPESKQARFFFQQIRQIKHGDLRDDSSASEEGDTDVHVEKDDVSVLQAKSDQEALELTNKFSRVDLAHR
jgi:hypothetical protein